MMTTISVLPAGQTRVNPWRAETCVLFLPLLLLSMLVGSVPVSAQTPASIATPTSVQTEARRTPTKGEILNGATKASGVAADHGAWRLTGTTRVHGADQAFEMTFDNRFRFRMAATGTLPQTDAFDGSTCWTCGPARIPHRIILQDRDLNRLIAWTISGAWAERSAPLIEETSPAAAGELAISLRPRDGVAAATLILDAATFLPKSLRYWTSSGDESWSFTNYRRFGERILPTHMQHRSGSQDDVIDIVAADAVEGAAPDFRMPTPDLNDAVFDAAANNTVKFKGIGGYMFVRPTVEGQEPGWFFLDTGADAMCIDPGIAKKLGLAVVGGDTTSGAVGVLHLDICRATTFQLGPVTIKNPVFLEFDLSAIAQAFKIPIVGICGFDFISRTSLEIDPKADTIRVFKPGAAELPAGASWTKIGFSSNTPCLECRFAGDHKGMFALDTGSGSTVDFFTPAVEKFHLLLNADQSKSVTGGAGGTAESRQGKIDWFELGGVKIEKPTVGFQLTKQGAFASPYIVGNIGMGFMGKFRLILDYQNERLAFAPEQPSVER